MYSLHMFRNHCTLHYRALRGICSWRSSPVQSCRQLTVPCTGCGVSSAFIDTPSSACLPESPVSVTYHVTMVGSCPFLCPSCMCRIVYHNISGLRNNQCINKNTCIIDARSVTFFKIWRHKIISMVSLHAWPPSARRAINLSLRHKILCNTLQCRH